MEKGGIMDAKKVEILTICHMSDDSRGSRVVRTWNYFKPNKLSHVQDGQGMTILVPRNEMVGVSVF